MIRRLLGYVALIALIEVAAVGVVWTVGWVFVVGWDVTGWQVTRFGLVFGGTLNLLVGTMAAAVWSVDEREPG